MEILTKQGEYGTCYKHGPVKGGKDGRRENRASRGKMVFWIGARCRGLIGPCKSFLRASGSLTQAQGGGIPNPPSCWIGTRCKQLSTGSYI